MSEDPIESWRPVVGYEDSYEVSDLGRVRRTRGTRGFGAGYVLKPFGDSDNFYPRVRLYRDKAFKRFLVSRLVAEAFIGPCPPGCGVNHIDSDPMNNRPGNLEWTTQLGNVLHALSNLRYPTKLQPDDVRAIMASKGSGSSSKVAQRYGVSSAQVRQIWLGRRWASVTA